MRIRQYGPNGVWDLTETYLEIKEKRDDETIKSRIQLDRPALSLIKNGKEIKPTPELYQINKELHSKKEFLDILFRINNLIRAYKLKPMISIMYKRLAYQDKNVRVTMDSNLIYRSENAINTLQAIKLGDKVDWDTAKKYGDKYDNDKNVVLEIKYDKDPDAAPSWVDQMLEDLDLESEKFSKYAWSMYKLLSKILVK
jgi:SPX domain protein involved in polyphosphate accumulation